MHGVPEMKPRIDAEGTDLGYGLSSFGSSTGKGLGTSEPVLCFILTSCFSIRFQARITMHSFNPNTQLRTCCFLVTDCKEKHLPETYLQTHFFVSVLPERVCSGSGLDSLLKNKCGKNKTIRGMVALTTWSV